MKGSLTFIKMKNKLLSENLKTSGSLPSFQNKKRVSIITKLERSFYQSSTRTLLILIYKINDIDVYEKKTSITASAVSIWHENKILSLSAK